MAGSVTQAATCFLLLDIISCHVAMVMLRPQVAMLHAHVYLQADAQVCTPLFLFEVPVPGCAQAVVGQGSTLVATVVPHNGLAGS